MSGDKRGMETQFICKSENTTVVELINHILQNSSEDSESFDTFQSIGGFKWAVWFGWPVVWKLCQDA